MAVTSLVAPISGRYSASYGTAGAEVSLGCLQNGVRLVQSVSKQVITCDTYGDSVVDAVYRGGNVSISLEGIEYEKAVAAVWPYGDIVSGTHPDIGHMGLVGRMDVASSLTQSLLLEAAQGTPANPTGVAGSPFSIQVPYAMIDEGQRTELLLANMLRTVPLVFRCYPYTDDAAPTSSANWKWFEYKLTP